MKVQAHKAVEAVQSIAAHRDELMALGGDAVHVGFCAAEDKDLPHLSTAEGNVPIPDGAWLVKDGDEFSVMSAEAFAKVYAA